MLVTEQAKQAKKFRLSVKITASVIILIAIAGFFEVTARIVYAYREEIRSSPILSGLIKHNLILDSYEMLSPSGYYQWVLRPGYRATQDKLVAEKKVGGRELGVSILQSNVNKQGGKRKAVFRINADGFKGPELDKTHTRPRILALGDSTTFGSGVRDYPRRLETVLNQRGIPVEVVNGGVEGYSPRNLLYEIERYKALNPEIVILYIGWNALYSDNPWKDTWENRLRILWLYKHALRTLNVMFYGAHDYAKKMYNRELKPFPESPDVKALEAYTPPFMDRIEKIIDEFKTIGTRVTLVTLPGLFTLSVSPSPKALKIGHLPEFTENPFVLAKLAARYNIALRNLAARDGLDVIDLEKWSLKALRPRDAFFSDSVHLTARGQEMIGVFMADTLEKQMLKN